MSIPTVRDRVVQSALKTVIEPIFEADMLECSYGFRPRRSQHDALQVLVDEAWDGRRWVAESDVSNCFGAIPHDGLMSAIEERISDRHVLKLLRAMLRSGVMQDGAVERKVTGTPQGGVISPCLCNVYLHRLDRQWAQRGHGVLVRFADDLLVMCRTREEAEAALAALRLILAELGLELKDAKTRIVHLKEGGEGVDFLGFHHRWVRANRAKHVQFLARWPSRKAMQHARDRVREITDAPIGCCVPVDDIVQDLNGFLRGWAGYFRYGNSARHFDAISHYAAQPCRALHVAKRHATLPRLRLGGPGLQLAGPSRADRPRRNRRRATPAPGVAREMSRMPAVKNVGEPCAGEPHARIEVAAGGNQTSRASTRRAVQAPLADPTRSDSSAWLPLSWRSNSQNRCGRASAL